MNAAPSKPQTAFPVPRILGVAVALMIVLGTFVLFFLDPATHGFYPQCMFHRVTGLNCPGCGGLRALHQLAHGHLATAFRYNALVVLGLPIAAVWAVRKIWPGSPAALSTIETYRAPFWLWTLVVVMVVFGIVRNLPFPVLAQLSP
jgi:hypothetical protein